MKAPPSKRDALMEAGSRGAPASAEASELGVSGRRRAANSVTKVLYSEREQVKAGDPLAKALRTRRNSASGMAYPYRRRVPRRSPRHEKLRDRIGIGEISDARCGRSPAAGYGPSFSQARSVAKMRYLLGMAGSDHIRTMLWPVCRTGRPTSSSEFADLLMGRARGSSEEGCGAVGTGLEAAHPDPPPPYPSGVARDQSAVPRPPSAASSSPTLMLAAIAAI